MKNIREAVDLDSKVNDMVECANYGMCCENSGHCCNFGGGSNPNTGSAW